MASLKDISRDTGFDVSVVSRALSPDPSANARVSTETRAVIAASAARLGFRPNRAAEFLRRGGSPAIGVFIPEYSNRLVADLVIGLSEAAAPLGFPLSLYFGITLESYDLFLDNASDAAHSGIITYPFDFKMLSEETIAGRLESYRSEKGSVLVLNSEDTPMGVPALSIDNRFGGELAARRLLARGCRKYLTYPRFPGRTEGFVETLGAEGKTAEILDEKGLRRSLDTLASGKEACFPTGLFATTDEHALMAYQAARERGLRVGSEILVIGYDDLCMTAFVDPPLTTVHQPFRELGARAVAKMVNMIYGKDELSEKIQPRLAVRDSA